MRIRNTGRVHERGMGLIELMIAMTVLAVGLLGVAALIATAVATNSKSKLDTGATMLAQSVLERLASTSAAQDLPLQVTDCDRTVPGGRVWPITTVGAAGGAGAQLDGNDADGDGELTEINFEVDNYDNLAAAGYAMRFTGCGAPGTQPVYEVRWNVRRLNAFTKLVTVGVRQVTWGNRNTAQARYIPPISLNTIAGN